MWARVVEAMLAAWLAASPFIFAHPASETALWVNDWACATVIVFLALASYWRPLRHAHLAIILPAAWLVGWARLVESSSMAALENNTAVGLTLLMLAVVPNHASRPPDSWRKFNESKSPQGSS